MFLSIPCLRGEAACFSLPPYTGEGQGLGVVQGKGRGWGYTGEGQGITPPLSPRPASEAGKHVPLYSLSARRGGMFLPSPVHGGRAGVRGSTGKGKG
jgi:hypothetical protein